MKVLLIGNGGREHALAWKLRQSPRISELYCAPGNGGSSGEAECAPVALKNLESIVRLAAQIKPDMTLGGPEQPHQLGIVDKLPRHGLAGFGPRKASPQLSSTQ